MAKRAVVLSVVLGLLASSSPATGLEIGPDADLCAALSQVQPGEELLLEPGEYRGGCVVRRGGLPGAPIVIRAADPDRRPHLTRPGQAVNMLEIRASDITIRDLEFGPTVSGADGVRIIVGHRITIEGCHFTQMGGIAVVATHTSVRGLTVRGNVITDSNATGMYFGCHDGFSCTVSSLQVEGNYIRGVRAPDPEIGYGVQVKLNSAGLIRGNIILDTKGPGIMVYGSRDLVAVSVVERNFIRGSRTSSGIVVGGGPAVAQNNISGWNAQAGIALENYGRRELLRGILLAHNTVYGNGEGGIIVPAQGLIDAAILNNAAHAGGGTPALPSPRLGLQVRGNLDCTWLLCFANPEGLDFSPMAGSLLTGPSPPRARGIAISDDFFGAPRRIPPAIGAIERPAGPIHLRTKP